jgi:hypothetical protein
MMFYHDVGVFFHLCGGIGVTGCTLIGSNVCYRKHFSRKEGMLAFGVTPKVFSPCWESAMSPSPLAMLHGHMDGLVRVNARHWLECWCGTLR